MKLVIIRHAETNQAAGIGGDPDAPSPAGHGQIEELVKTCRGEGVEAVFHSTQARAVFTAEALATALDVSSFAQSGLEERNFGDWEEWQWPQIAAKLERLSTEQRYTIVPPKGESWQQMEQRLSAALKEIVAQPYSSVAVVTHWGAIRALLPVVKHEPKESTLSLNVENGQAFVVEYQDKVNIT